MAKSNERNLNVTINNSSDDKDEVVISVSGILKKLKKYFLPWLIISAMLGAVIVGIKTASAIKSKPPLTALVSFNYSGIEKGLDPNGKTFDVNTIKNPEVISGAVSDLDMDASKVELIRQYVSIAGVIPADAVDRLTLYHSVKSQSVNGSVAPVQAILETSYYPTQYKITFNYSKTGLSKDDAVQVLNGMLDKYRDYFYRQYGYNQSLGAAVTTLDYKSYDYPEAIDLFRSTLNTLATYLKDLSSEDLTRFRSSTGYTFEDLYESVITVRALDLDKAQSLVTVNNITKDRQQAIDTYQYKIDALTRQKERDEESYKAVQTAKENYQKDKLLVMQSADGTNTEISKTSEEYDILVDKEVRLASDIAETKQKIKEYSQRKEALEKSKGTASEAQIKEIDERLESINTKVNDLVVKIKDTSDEYFKNVEFANAYSILVPATKTNDISVTAVAKNSVKSAIIYELLIFFIYFGISFVTAIIDENKKNRKLKTANGGSDGDGDNDDDGDDDDDTDEIIEDVAEALGAEVTEKEAPKTNNQNKKKKK
ncbi:MAG: lipopolysaccharide biosynthesis protein [Ruminococcus sp.]|nr:lipopolysaccharide biosynthesis protein [Ruminococcus sp.]